jgi:hypothetical protein
VWLGVGRKNLFNPPPPIPKLLNLSQPKPKQSQESSYGNLKREMVYFPPPPSDLMARFTLGQRTKMSTPLRPIPKA